MAPLSWQEMAVSWLFYATLLAVALAVAGAILIVAFGLNTRLATRTLDDLEERVSAVEARLDRADRRETD